MPHQDLLALHSRDWIDLDLDMVTPDSLNSLGKYLQVWIVFYLHLKFNA